MKNSTYMEKVMPTIIPTILLLFVSSVIPKTFFTKLISKNESETNISIVRNSAVTTSFIRIILSGKNENVYPLYQKGGLRPVRA